MAKKQNKKLKVKCVFNKDGQKLDNIIKEAFLLYVKGELAKKSTS